MPGSCTTFSGLSGGLTGGSEICCGSIVHVSRVSGSFGRS